MNKAKWVVLFVCLTALVAGISREATSASARTDDSRVLTKAKFIHYRDANAKPPQGGGGKKQTDAYYTFISKGAKWRVLEDFALNPTNGDGMTEAMVIDAVAQSMGTWESSAGQIFGNLSVDYSAVYDDTRPDGVNTLSFGPISDARVIAVTNVWGYFSGSPNTREIVEADILFNDSFAWGDADVNAALMDLQNIATHEIGHVAGMGDIYQTGANLETMYGYSTEGETIKRDLYNGDIAGIQILY
jgi:hypothetical protein